MRMHFLHVHLLLMGKLSLRHAADATSAGTRTLKASVSR